MPSNLFQLAEQQLDISKTKDLAQKLKNRIFGQDHIIDAVADMIDISAAGLGDMNKPIASFLFTGPTGVGKTELAKELAKLLDTHFERFDMSEYADEYSARNLTGGQKGLVGYEDGGLLTNAISEHPHCVLLLDEIEKADKAVYNTFLQVLDYGTLKDTKGKEVDFTQTIIIMTSNLGATEKRGIGFGENTNIYKESAVVDFLTPEFRNRLDGMLEFNRLTPEVIVYVIDKYLDDFSGVLLEKSIRFNVSDEAKVMLNVIGFKSDMGARSVHRMINGEFKRNISREILYGNLTNGGHVSIDINDKGFVYCYDRPLSKVPEIEIPKVDTEPDNLDCDFETAEEAMEYARNNAGVVVSRSKSGHGYDILRH